MYICFAEYRIKTENKIEYLHYIEQMKTANPALRVYEGTDQPDLFVEVWQAESAEEAEQIKKERLSERSSWCQMADWVPGGLAKVHVWTFKPISAPS
ncbi:hypothetical protein SAMN04487969_12437 [Paenibacillus algorifonticola]|uniref:NIPSNAP domain-containing protein n=1 Tax=Paenibacillus algorifonticola TaxID=684063 RepID=A0A1I2HJK3_9BACL|nr:hypothetical protein [Paenibacillus algorifonticola]SFF30334.1 hypothetical protein SAMN04487969_12437 [Paenibacillus algorifonticola]